MERNQLLKFCIEKGILLDTDIFDVLETIDVENAKKIIEKFSQLNKKIITKAFLSENAREIVKLVGNKEIVEKLKIQLGVSIEISREIKDKIVKKTIGDSENEEGDNRFKNIKITKCVLNTVKKLEAKDFVRYFKTRYMQIKRILQERAELENIVSINKIGGQRQVLSIIGLVYSRRITKNKNIILEVEDLTGRIKILINKNKEDLYNKAKDILIDDVVGIMGSGNSEILFANSVYFPDIYVHEKVKLDKDEAIAFISDIHVGSINFLEKNFLKFIDWLNGNSGSEKQKQEALKIKYLFVNGDGVDGVGIFPGQEEQLNIKDIKQQYVRLAELLGKIRKDVTILISPGQHDAVRVAEPQPPINKDYASALYFLDNLIFLSNPAMVEIRQNGGRGMKILNYHGASMHWYVSEIEELRMSNAHDSPTKVVKNLLKRRHLASMHSLVTYIPTENGELFIDEVPDVITTGDFHRPDIDIYNNVLIICSSCWQSITPFEEKVGNHPDPCKVPVLNLKTRQIKILDFSDLSESVKEKEKDEES